MTACTASTRYLSRVFGRERYGTLPKGASSRTRSGTCSAPRARRARRKRRRGGGGAAKDSETEKNHAASRVVDAIREAHRPFGAYVSVASVDPDAPASPCGHIDGRDSRPVTAEPCLVEEKHTSEEAWGELEGKETDLHIAAGGEGDDDALLARDFVPGFFDPPDAVALPGDVWI